MKRLISAVLAISMCLSPVIACAESSDSAEYTPIIAVISNDGTDIDDCDDYGDSINRITSTEVSSSVVSYYADVTEDAITNYTETVYSSGRVTLKYYTVSADGMSSMTTQWTTDDVIVFLTDPNDTAVLDDLAELASVTTLDSYAYSVGNTGDFSKYATDEAYVLEGILSSLDDPAELYEMDNIAAVYNLYIYQEAPDISPCWGNNVYQFNVMTDYTLPDAVLAEIGEYSLKETTTGYTVSFEELNGSYFDVMQVLYACDGVYYVDFNMYICTTITMAQLRCSYVSNQNLIGDITGDGVVSVADVVVMSRYAASVEAISDEDFESCDLYVDGVINVSDALVLMRYLVDIEEELPVYPAEQKD